MPQADDRNSHFAALAKRVAEKRDKAAFAELFDYFAPRLESYLRSLGLESSAAEDIAQDVMIVLWQKADMFDPAKSSLSTWLFRIARNRRIDVARRATTRILDPDEPMLLPSDVEPADETFDANRRDEIIREAMKSLPEDQVALLREAFFLGKTHAQIASETGLPLGTVKSRIRLGFERLRAALERNPRIDTD